MGLVLGSPVVPITLFLGSGVPYIRTNPKKGALITTWLLGYEVSGMHKVSGSVLLGSAYSSQAELLPRLPVLLTKPGVPLQAI